VKKIQNIDDTLDGLKNSHEKHENIVAQQIKELDLGNQGLLEKLLELEKTIGEGIASLEITDKEIGQTVNSLNEEMALLKANVQKTSEEFANSFSKQTEDNKKIYANDIKSINENIVRLEKHSKETIERYLALETKTVSIMEKIQEIDNGSMEKMISVERNAESLKQEFDSGNQQLLEKLLAVEEDFEVRMKGINDSAISMVEKVSSLDKDTKSNSQKIIRLEENMHLQIENSKNLEQEIEIGALKTAEEFEKMNISMQDQISVALDTVKDDMRAIEGTTNEALNNFDEELKEKLKIFNSGFELKIRRNTDDIRRIDDSIDGMKALIDNNETKTTKDIRELNAFNISVSEMLKEAENKYLQLSKSSLNEANELIKELEEKQKSSANQIKELDLGNQGLLEKLLDLEKNLGEGVAKLEAQDKNVSQTVSILETELHTIRDETSKKSEEMSASMVRITDETNKLYSEELRVLKESFIANNETMIKSHSQLAHSVETLDDKINNIEEKQPKFKAQMEKLEAQMTQNDDRLTAIENEQLKLVESLDGSIKEMNSVSQKHELMISENLQRTQSNLSEEMKKIKQEMEENYLTVKDFNLGLNNSEKSYIEKINMLTQESTKDFEKLKLQINSSIEDSDGKLTNLRSSLQTLDNDCKSTFSDHDERLKKLLEANVEQSNFYGVISTNIESMENKMSSYDSKQKAMTENILITNDAQVSELRNKFDVRISEIMKKVDNHSNLLDQGELNLVDMKRKFDEAQLHSQRDLEEIRKKSKDDKETVVFEVETLKERLETFFSSSEEKLEFLDKAYIRESSKVEVIEKKLSVNEKQTSKLEVRIRDMDKIEEDTSSIWKQLTELQEYINVNKEDLQSIRINFGNDHQNLQSLIQELYSAFRGFTIVLKSEGIVKKHQADVLGVYRMVDTYNDRPVYKQDGGENYVYYSSTSNTWFVGTVVGHQYGWLRNSTEKASSQRWIPDLKTGWEYRPLVRSSENIDNNTWHSDDGSLRIEYLKDIEKVSELFRDVKELKI